MSDFDFLKQFGKNLDQEQPLEPAEAEWTKLALALEHKELLKRRRRLLLAWAFPVLASLALGVLGTQLWQSGVRSDAMQVEINRLNMEMAAQKSVSVADTTVRHLSVIQYDTVYRTIIMRSYLQQEDVRYSASSAGQQLDSIVQVHNNPALLPSHQQPGEDKAEPSITSQTRKTGEERVEKDAYGQKANEILALTDTQDKSKSSATFQSEQPDPAKLPSGANIPDTMQAVKSHAWQQAVSLLPTSAILTPKSMDRRHLPNVGGTMVEAPAPAKARVPVIRRLRAQGGMAGITGGILFPQTQDALFQNNYTLGVTGQIAFGRRLRLVGAAESGWTNFTVKGDALDNSNIPTLTPPTPDYVLKDVEVKQPLVDFSLGLRYCFAPEKRLRPFVGAAWLGEQTQEQTLKYEFRNQVMQNEPYFLLVPRNESRFNANGFQVSLGTDWFMTKRVSFGLEALYQRQFASTVPLLGERWVLKAGLSYSF